MGGLVEGKILEGEEIKEVNEDKEIKEVMGSGNLNGNIGNMENAGNEERLEVVEEVIVESSKKELIRFLFYCDVVRSEVGREN